MRDLVLLTMMIMILTMIANDDDNDDNNDSDDKYDDDDRCQKEKSSLKERAFENLENQPLHNYDAAHDDHDENHDNQ